MIIDARQLETAAQSQQTAQRSNGATAATSPDSGSSRTPHVSRRFQTHSKETVTCAHCGDPVLPGLIDPDAPQQFCCSGCQTVYNVIHGCGLERYYRLRAETSNAKSPARATGRRYSEFDDPTFARLYCKALGDSIWSVELYLEGVHCAACVWLVEKLPTIASGVLEARLDLRRALVRLVWDKRVTSLSAIARSLDSLGYPPHPARGVSASELRRKEDRRQLIRLGVAGACAGNVMLLSLALYAGMFSDLEDHYWALFRWFSMGITALSLAWPGSVFFRGAWAALRTRTQHLDLPIAVGLGAGGLWGIANTIRGTGEIYFDSLSVLVFALLVGRWFQQRQQRWTSDAVELLFSLTPTTARVVEDDQVREVPIEAVNLGQVVEVRAGDSVPVDGTIISGTSNVDQSLLTGEAMPVRVDVGDRISAGVTNLSSPLRVEVEATGEDTRIGKLMRMVEECSRRRAPIVRLADRIAGLFVTVMLALAAATAAIWAVIEPSHAVEYAVALLIVTCPCALGLATPLAVTVAIGRAARRGLLVKGGEVIERLAKPGEIFLDKTGTITEGRLTLVRWIGSEQVKPIAAALESHSSHPIALAISQSLRDDTDWDMPVSNVMQTTGAGIQGEVDGQWVTIGSPTFVREQCGACDDAFSDAESELVNAGLTPVLIAVNGTIKAAAGLGDPIRPDAQQAIDALRRLGWRVRILSGDHPSVVQTVGRQLGIDAEDCRGGASPEAKLAVVNQVLQRGTVVMVGDGVNDAAALAAATIGIAVHGGAEASLAAADVFIKRPGLSPIVELAIASRRTMRVIHRNLAVSLFYNAFAASLAITGVITPLIAAILMPLSSLSVVTLSYKSRTFGDIKS